MECRFSHHAGLLLILLVLLGAAFPAHALEYIHHGPYPYSGHWQLGGYSDPNASLYHCQIYRDQESSGNCHNNKVGYSDQPQYEGAEGMCGGANPVEAWFYNAGGGVYRYFWHCTVGTSGSCPTGMEPGVGADGACGYPEQCPVGDVQRFHATAGEPIPQSVCSNGCWYERNDDDLPLTYVMAGQSWSGNFSSTGNACAVGGGTWGTARQSTYELRVRQLRQYLLRRCRSRQCAT